MESELSVIRSHLQHICNFGVPQVIVHYDLDAFLNIHEVVKAHGGRRVLLPGALSGPEGAVDDGGHPGWTENQQGSLPLPVGITEAPQ